MFKRQRQYLRFKDRLKRLDTNLTDVMIIEETQEELEIEELDREIEMAIEKEKYLNEQIKRMETENELDLEEISNIERAIKIEAERQQFLNSEIEDLVPDSIVEARIGSVKLKSKFLVFSLSGNLGGIVWRKMG